MPEDILLSILEAVKTGQWWLAVAGLLSLSAVLLRRHGAALWAPLASTVGVVASTFALSGLGGVAHALAAGAALDWSLLTTALQIGASASGLWALLEYGLRRAAGGGGQVPQEILVYVDGRAVRTQAGAVTGRELREVLEVPEGRRICPADGDPWKQEAIGADDTVALSHGRLFHTRPGSPA